MLETITDYLSSLNQLAVQNQPGAALPYMMCANTSKSLSQNDFRTFNRSKKRHGKSAVLTRCKRVICRNKALKKEYEATTDLLATVNKAPRISAGQGRVPEQALFAPLTTPRAECIRAAVELLAPCGRQITAGQASHPHALGTLAAFDQAVTRVFHQLLPWNQAAAVTDSLSTSASTAVAPGVAPAIATYRIHHRGADITLFRQQVDEFLQRMKWQPDDQLKRQWVNRLLDQNIIFIYSDINDPHRPERAHIDEMKRRTMLYEMAIRDATMSTDSIGAKIIAWGDEQAERSYTLFMQGVKNYNPFYFLAAGGEAIAGQFARTIGEIFDRTILDRQPGESEADRFQRLLLNVLMPPDAVASKAFRFTSSVTPTRRLYGTVLTHPRSGMTLHSSLQSSIAGQSWHLHPLGSDRAMAVQSAAQPAVSRVASRSADNKWRIEGIAGEHSFFHGKSAEWFIESDKLYYPVRYSPEERTVELHNGQKIYFHEASRQWKILHPDNIHLPTQVLAILPEGISRSELGAQATLASVGYQNSEVWSAVPDGSHYLKVIRQATSTTAAEISWVAGRLEGQYFSVRAEESQPVYRQLVLKWQPERHQWVQENSPFSRLQMAQQHIDLSQLQQILDPQANLVRVHNRPGLYRYGKELFIRWQTDEEGVDWFLPLVSTPDALEYRTPQPGAEAENYFSYHPATEQWYYRPLTSEAFFGLSDAVKIEHPPAFDVLPTLPEYRYLRLSGSDFYLQTGADNMGIPQYIRVEQDAEDGNLFSLRVPDAEDGPDSRWVFRYDEDNEFVLEEQRQCPVRVKRASDDELCAGPSGIKKSPSNSRPYPAAKKVRLGMMNEEQTNQWLMAHPRTGEEQVQKEDSLAVAGRKNLAYALRLNMWSPAELALSSIASHAGLPIRRINYFLSNTSPEGCYILLSHPWQAGESDISYALRLYQSFNEFTPRIIASFTGIKESRLLSALRRQAADEGDWFSYYPKNQFESDLKYAMRLYRLSENSANPKAIAAHTGVNELTLRLSMKDGEQQGKLWLSTHLRQTGETDMNYAMRLYQQPHENVSIQMIAEHTGVDKDELVIRLGDRWNVKLQKDLERQWLSSYPRHLQETNFDYAWRLLRLRDIQINAGELGKKVVRNNIIALHANLSPGSFSTILSEVKISRQWCNNHPRLAQELLTGDETDAVAMEKNKNYAMRLMQLRSEQQKARVRYSVIANHVGVTESNLKIWVTTVRHSWLAANPRIGNEISAENADEYSIQRNNQFYARRLAQLRDKEQMGWLISDTNLAKHADVTMAAFKQAVDPFFGFIKSQPLSPVNSEGA